MALTLEQIIEKARSHTITPAEKRAQRVSLITGVLSSDTTLTRDKVESLLNQIEGHTSEPEKEKA
jgi:hypothetical protein